MTIAPSAGVYGLTGVKWKSWLKKDLRRTMFTSREPVSHLQVPLVATTTIRHLLLVLIHHRAGIILTRVATLNTVAVNTVGEVNTVEVNMVAAVNTVAAIQIPIRTISRAVSASLS